MKRTFALLGLAMTFAASAAAKTIEVKVDAKTMPWDVRVNRALRFGLNDGRPPVIVRDPAIKGGATLTFSATGSVGWAPGGRRFGPDGDPSFTNDFSLDYLPSHHMRSTGEPVFMAELVGAFISADGLVVGKPFPIGKAAKVVAPPGAVGLSLGVNDDAYHDNTGTFSVSIFIPVGTVTVEGSEAKSDPTATGAPTPPAPATVQRTIVTLDASTAPWDPAINATATPIGAKGAKPPVIVPIAVPAGKAVIFAEGTTDIAEAKGLEAVGDTHKTINDTLAADGQRYPSFYVPKLLYPAFRHGLVAAFVDANGAVIGRPLMVGKGVRVAIPDTAAGLALGFNDTDFAGNRGDLKVTVELPPQD